MFKQINFLQNYTKKLLNSPEITYCIYKSFNVKRNYCTHSDSNKSRDTQTSNLIPYTLGNNERLIPKRKAERLYDVLNVSNQEGFELITECPKLRKIAFYILKLRIKLYTDKQIEMKILLKYPWLMTIQEDKIVTKLKLIEELPLALNESVTLLRQSNSTHLKKICSTLKREYHVNKVNRMKLVAEKLQCPVDEVCYATGRYHFFPLISIERVGIIADILKSKNVPTDQILRDFWIFKYKSNTVANRLEAAEDSNVTNIRTWMVRCKTETYNRMLSRHRENKMVLGNLPSIKEYLSDRLNLNMVYAKAITDKHPEIKRMNITKAKNVIDYLFSEQYTPMHIIRSPRILCCKLETIKKRLIAFKAIGYKPTSLVIICKSQVQFDIYFKIVLKKLEKAKESTSM